MSASSADELHGSLPSLCIITSRAAGAKRFIGARERGFRFVDLEPRVQVPKRPPCVLEDGGVIDGAGNVARIRKGWRRVPQM